MEKLSVVIITYNEEKNIERCLRSVKAVADEIVVVDSFSSDRTREICKTYDVTFIERSFPGHIQQKNFALSKATHKYALSLDADEALSDKLSESILKEKTNGFPFDGYSMNRLNKYCGKWIRHGSFYPDRKLRLVRVEKSEWGGTNPHDKLLLQPGSKVKKLAGDILHHTHSSYEEHLLKSNKYSTIAAREKYRKGKSASLLNIVVNPAWSFARSYIFRLGFLDGVEGYMIAKLSALETFLKYAKLRKMRE